MNVANDSEYGLSSSVFTNDANNIYRFVDEIETGMTHINSPTTGGEAHIPFGGIKSTGIGAREQGSTSLGFLHGIKSRIRRLHRKKTRREFVLKFERIVETINFYAYETKIAVRDNYGSDSFSFYCSVLPRIGSDKAGPG